MDCIPPGCSVHGSSQASILEWVAISFPRTSSWPRDWTNVSCIGRQILYHWATTGAQGKYRKEQIYVLLLSILRESNFFFFFTQRMCSIRLFSKGFTPSPYAGLSSTCLLCHPHFQTGTCWRQIRSEFFSQADEKLDLESALVIMYFKTGKDLRCHDRRPLVVLRHLPLLLLPEQYRWQLCDLTATSHLSQLAVITWLAGCLNGSCVLLLDHAF